MPSMVSGAATGRAVVALALVGLLLLGLNDPGRAAERDEIVRVVSVEQLNDYYNRLDYAAEALAAGGIIEVPRLRLGADSRAVERGHLRRRQEERFLSHHSAADSRGQ